MPISGKNTMELIIAAHDRTKGAFGRIGAQMKGTKGSATRLNGAMNALKGGMSGAASSITSFGAALGPAGIAVAAVAVGAATLGGAALKASLEFEKAFATIRVGTGATGDTLAGLEDSLKTVFTEVPTTTAAAATAIADLNTRLGLTGEPLEALATQFLNLSRITGTDVAASISSATRVMHDFDVSTKDQAAALDYLFKVSQSTGLGMTQLGNSMTQYGSVMRQMGFDINESAALLGKFEKEGVNLELVLGSLRMGLANFAKAGEEPVEALQRVITEIQGMSSVADANLKAIEIFGSRAGPDMAAAIREGRFSISELMATLDASSETINKAAENTMQFGDKWTLFKNQIMASLVPAGDVIKNVLGKAIEGLGAAFSAMQKVAGPVLDLLFIQFHILKAFLDGLFEPVMNALKPLSGLFGDTSGAVSNLNVVLNVMKDVFTIITGVAGKLGTILGTLLAKAITPLVAKIKEGIATLTEFYNKLGPIKGLIEGVKDKVGAGADAIGKWAESFTETVPPVEELTEAVSGLTEEAKTMAPILSESIKTLESSLTGASGSYKTAIGDISKEIETLKDAWNLASDDQKKAIEDQIDALEDIKSELEDGEEAQKAYFDATIEGTKEAVEAQKEFKVTIGDTTITFKDMAAEVVKNADAYADLQKNAETLLDLDWSVFTELEANLPNIDKGIGDMSMAFTGLKGVLDDNIIELENVKQSVMDISEIAAPFLEAGFLNGIKSIGSFAGALSDAGSAINTFGSLTEVNVEGCINFSTSVYSMVSALGILETQMHDMKPAFADMEAGMKATVEAFIYPGGGSEDMEARITDPIKAYKDILDKYGLTGDWKNEILTEYYGENWARTFSGVSGFDPEEYALEAIGVRGGDLSIFQKARDDYNDTMLEIKGSTRPQGFAFYTREYGISAVLKESGDDINEYANNIVHSSKAISRAVDSQVKTLKYWSDQLTKITDALKPYLNFMRTLNEITALSTLSIDDINAGFSAITDTLGNLSSALEKVDFAPIMESLFGESLGEFEFAGGSATEFIELMATYAPKLDTLVTFTESLSSAIINLTTAFDALVDIEDSVLLDTDKLALVLKNTEDIINNLANALSTEGGNFAAILATAFTDLLEAADPLIVWFRKNSVQVTEFNTTLSSLLMTVTHVIDVMTALKEITTLTLPEINDLAAGFDKTAEFVRTFDEALMMHVGAREGQWDMEKYFNSVFSSIKNLASSWEALTYDMGDSFDTFEDAISTIIGLIGNITSLTKAFTDMKDIIIPDAIEMEAALSKIPAVIKNMTAFLGKETWTAISGNIAEFALKWESVNEGISTSIDSFSHFVGTITKIISACTEMTRIFTDMGDVIVITSDEIAYALKDIPEVMAQVTEYLTTDSFKAIKDGLIDLDTEYKIHAKVLDGVMPSYDSAFDMFAKLTSNVVSLSKAFEELKEATIISSIDMDRALQNIDVFINRFVDALTLNFDTLVGSLTDLHVEWGRHSKEMEEIMPTYETATGNVGTLISTLLSLTGALKSLAETGTISSTKFDTGFSSIVASVANFTKSLQKNVAALIISLSNMRTAWIENESTLVPLMLDFRLITRSLASLAYNANLMSDSFSEFSKNSGRLKLGFERLIDFINQVVDATKTFYTPESARAIAQYIIDVGLVISAFRLLSEQLGSATRDIKEEVDNAVNTVAAKVLSLKTLIPNMYMYGGALIISFASGMNAYKSVLEQVLISISNMIKNYLGVQSPTELGPLKKLNEWPKNLVKTFSKGIESEMGTLNASFSGMSLAAPGGGGGGNVTHISFNVTQNIKDRATGIEATNELERMLQRHEML